MNSSSSSSVSRREFLQSTAVAGTGLAIARVAPSLLGQVVTGSASVPASAWAQKTMRWAQLMLVEDDPAHFDPAFWFDYFKRTRSDGVCLSGGGCVAYYPTEIPFHHRSAWLGDRDVLGELVTGCRKLGMAVLIRTDPHATYDDAKAAHPDWIAVEANGNPRRHWSSPEMWVTCALGPYNFEFMTAVHKEIMARYHADGIFMNRWEGSGDCYCVHCRENFKAASGFELPRTTDARDPVRRAFLEWRRQRLVDVLDVWNGEIRAINPESSVVPNNGSGSVPYDSSETPWQYSLTLKVNTAFGIPTGSITMMDNSSTCPPGTSAAGGGAATCAVANYSGVACPQNSAAGNLVIQNGGTPNSSGTSFTTSCLYQVPSGTTYTPVVYTHYVTPVYSGDANFQSFTGPSTLFQATRGPLVQITTPAASSATAAPTLSITAGSSASITLDLTSILGYGISGKNALLNNSTFPITLNCDNLPPHATCSFYYPNPDANIATATDIPWPANCTTQEVAEGLADSSGDLCVPSLTPVSTSSGTMTTGTGQVVMTINTNVTVGTTTSKNATDTSATLAALFGFGMIGLFVRRRTFEKGRRLLMILLMVIAPALAISITACNTTNLSPEAVLSSPSGSYAVTVTAQQVGDQCEPSGPLGSNCTTTSGGTGQLAHGSNNPVSLPFHINVTVQ